MKNEGTDLKSSSILRSASLEGQTLGDNSHYYETGNASQKLLSNCQGKLECVCNCKCI